MLSGYSIQKCTNRKHEIVQSDWTNPNQQAKHVALRLPMDALQGLKGVKCW